VASHYAVAACQLAREGQGHPESLARYRQAESHFRAQATRLGLHGVGMSSPPLPRWPVVRLDDGVVVPLTVGFVRRHDPWRWNLPHRSIDSGLVHLARRLLEEWEWYLPGEGNPPGEECRHETGHSDGQFFLATDETRMKQG